METLGYAVNDFSTNSLAYSVRASLTKKAFYDMGLSLK